MTASRSLQLRALAIANEVRGARARLRRRVAVGEQSAAEVILDPPREADNWPVIGLLLSQPRWGQAKCRRLLVESGIDGRKPIGRLTVRQRHVLAEYLGARASSSGRR
jgi:hypothetical protein